MPFVLFLGILLILGLASSRVTKLVKLPNVTGYLVIGLLAAIVCLVLDNCVEGSSLCKQLTELNEIVSMIALGFIALSIGEEFKISKIKQYGSKIILITVLQALCAVVFVDVALLIACTCLGLNYSIAIILGSIATATAPAATLMVIHQYKAKGPLVDILLPVVAFDDAIGLIVFAISLSLSKLFVGTTNVSVLNILVVPLIEIFGSLAIGYVLGLLMHIVMRFFKSRNNHMIVIIAFTLLGVGCCEALNQLSLWGDPLEFSNLLTCMMIGAVYVNMAKDEEKPIVTRDIELMDRWTPFLFMLFFVLSGAHLAIAAYSMFNSAMALIVPLIIVFAVYLIMRSAGKYFGAFLGSKITKQTPEICKYLGITLLPQAGVAIGMANQISNMAIFQKDNIGNIIVTVVLSATLVYELIGPLLTKWALNRAHEIPKEEENALSSQETNK